MTSPFKTKLLFSAEEYSKFAFPAMEIVMAGFLSHPEEEKLMCIARIVEFLQNHARNGWTEQDAQLFHEMALRYAVLVEETGGPQRCVITLHSLIHFKEDIMAFSGLDNYSCWAKERAVRRYIKQSNNHKNIECTFAATEIRREVLKARRDNREIADPVMTDPDMVSKKCRSILKKT